MMQGLLVIVFASGLPLYAGYLHLAVRERALGFALMFIGLAVPALLFGYFSALPSKLTLGVFALAAAVVAIYSAFQESRIPHKAQFFLNGLIAATNLMIAGVYINDVLNLRAGELSDDETGLIVGFTCALIAVFTIERRRRSDVVEA